MSTESPEINIQANAIWFFTHVIVLGFTVSYLLDMFVWDLEGYQWFLAPAGAFSSWYVGFRKDPITVTSKSIYNLK